MADNTLFLILHKLSKRISFAKTAAWALVGGLLMGCGPTAVLRGVRPVIVDPVDRVSIRWPYAYVREKIIKRIPSSADVNSTVVVVTVPFVIGCASSAHVQPCVIFRRSSHVMFRELIGSPFTLQATATALFPTSKIGLMRQTFRTAVASTNPSAFNPFLGAKCDNQKTTEAFSYEV